MPDAPAIPQRCTRHPLPGGLAVPYISLVADGRTHLGGTHGIRVAECVTGYWCQVCGWCELDWDPGAALAVETVAGSAPATVGDAR